MLHHMHIAIPWSMQANQTQAVAGYAELYGHIVATYLDTVYM